MFAVGGFNFHLVKGLRRWIRRGDCAQCFWLGKTLPSQLVRNGQAVIRANSEMPHAHTWDGAASRHNAQGGGHDRAASRCTRWN